MWHSIACLEIFLLRIIPFLIQIQFWWNNSTFRSINFFAEPIVVRIILRTVSVMLIP